MKIFSLDELSKENGQDGKRALVAFEGKVYDVTGSKKWPNGVHIRRHFAGCDLTAAMAAAPHKSDVMSGFPVVGTLEISAKGDKRQGCIEALDRWLEKHPFWRRHPHPSAVHFPIALFVVAFLLELAALISQSLATEWAAFCSLLLATLSVPCSLITGYLTWWINYESRDSKLLKRKRVGSFLLIILGTLAVLWRVFMIGRNPIERGLDVGLYIAALAALAAEVSFVGYLGGHLTFPYSKPTDQKN